MALSEDCLEYVRDQLGTAGPVQARRMFGGAGLYLKGVIFGLVAEDTLYLKVDDGNRPDFEARGMGPFAPFGDERYAMSYYEVPVEVLEDPDELALWAGRAVEASLRSKAKKKGKARPGQGKKQAG
jgi:DNA transformation protein and related proteins